MLHTHTHTHRARDRLKRRGRERERVIKSHVARVRWNKQKSVSSSRSTFHKRAFHSAPPWLLPSTCSALRGRSLTHAAREEQADWVSAHCDSQSTAATAAQQQPPARSYANRAKRSHPCSTKKVESASTAALLGRDAAVLLAKQP